MVVTFSQLAEVKVGQSCNGNAHHLIIQGVTDDVVASQEIKELLVIWAAGVDNRESGVIGVNNDIVWSRIGLAEEGHVALA